MEQEKQEKKKVGKKEYTFIAQIISSLWIAGWNSFQFIKIINSGSKIDSWDIISSGLAIAGCFAPVYLSIVLDKIKELKNRGE